MTPEGSPAGVVESDVFDESDAVDPSTSATDPSTSVPVETSAESPLANTALNSRPFTGVPVTDPPRSENQPSIVLDPPPRVEHPGAWPVNMDSEADAANEIDAIVDGLETDSSNMTMPL